MPNLNPLISIIIAAYNADETISRCLESCLSQTYTSFEVILVNDGSTDETATQAQLYAQQDSRIKVMSVPNGGQGLARNIGIAAASGLYVTILDADDTLDPTALTELTATARTCDADLVIAEWRKWDSAKQVTVDVPIFKSQTDAKTQKALKEYLITRTYFSVSKLYRKTLLTKHNIRFGEGYIYEDMEFLIGAVLHAESVAIIPRPLYTVHTGVGSSTKTNTQGDWHATSFEKAVHTTIEAYRDLLKPYRKQYTFYVLNRTYMYTKQDSRIPRFLWRHFSITILSLLQDLYDDRPTQENASQRYAVVLLLFRLHPYIGYVAFQFSNKLAKSSLKYQTALKK